MQKNCSDRDFDRTWRHALHFYPLRVNHIELRDDHSYHRMVSITVIEIELNFYSKSFIRWMFCDIVNCVVSKPIVPKPIDVRLLQPLSIVWNFVFFSSGRSYFLKETDYKSAKICEKLISPFSWIVSNASYHSWHKSNKTWNYSLL